MEQNLNKLNLKIIIPIVVIVIIAIVGGIVIFTNGSKNKGLTKEQCIGTWDELENNYSKPYRIVLNQGGTGKLYVNAEEAEKNPLDYFKELKWEINDNILNIEMEKTVISSDFKHEKTEGTTTTGYKVENGTITSLDTGTVYKKVK